MAWSAWALAEVPAVVSDHEAYKLWVLSSNLGCFYLWSSESPYGFLRKCGGYSAAVLCLAGGVVDSVELLFKVICWSTSLGHRHVSPCALGCPWPHTHLRDFLSNSAASILQPYMANLSHSATFVYVSKRSLGRVGRELFKTSTGLCVPVSPSESFFFSCLLVKHYFLLRWGRQIASFMVHSSWISRVLMWTLFHLLSLVIDI